MSKKLTQLGELITPSGNDLMYIVKQPDISNSSRRITITNLFGNIPVQVNIKGTDTVDVGEELLSNDGWTYGVDWTGNWQPNGFTHMYADPPSNLSNSIVATSGTSYLFFVTVDGGSYKGGTITINFGGQSIALASMDRQFDFLTATDNSSLVIVPDNLDGTMFISLKEYYGNIPSSLTLSSLDKTPILEIRAGASNLFMGLGAGEITISGYNNMAIGTGALQHNLTGSDNLVFGADALHNNETGFGNLAIGARALYNNKFGWGNIAIGTDTLGESEYVTGCIAIGDKTLQYHISNYGGNGQIAIGANSLFSDDTGHDSVAIGYGALQNSDYSNQNVAIGTQALVGVYPTYLSDIGDNTAVGYRAGAQLTAAERNTFLGAYAGAAWGDDYQSATVINSIAIGYNAGSHKSNQAVFGGRGITETLLRGNVLIGTETDGGMTASGSLAISRDLAHRGDKVGFYNTSPKTKITVSGSRAGNQALESLLISLSSLGLITNTSTA